MKKKKTPRKLRVKTETLANLEVSGAYYKTFTCTVCGCQPTEYTCDQGEDP